MHASLQLNEKITSLSELLQSLEHRWTFSPLFTGSVIESSQSSGWSMEGQKSRGRGGVKFTSAKNSTVLRSKHYLWTFASIAFESGIFSELTRFQMPLHLTGSLPLTKSILNTKHSSPWGIHSNYIWSLSNWLLCKT